MCAHVRPLSTQPDDKYRLKFWKYVKCLSIFLRGLPSQAKGTWLRIIFKGLHVVFCKFAFNNPSI
ncbi:hypothetical protein EFE42_07010 [Methanohalophilus sp. RSK]|nr:hypothetical protein EFE42_07010 [Methanohalophilus sp. RSK]